MIKLSNGHRLEFLISSGAFAFRGKGWLWERLQVELDLIDPSLFTIELKSLTAEPRKGNLNWANPLTWLPWSPWACVKLIHGGSVNKVGLSNRGIDWWCKRIAPKIDFEQEDIIVSLYGTTDELIAMASRLDRYDLVAITVNDSCPNSGHALEASSSAIRSTVAVRHATRHPVLVKVSAAQDYCAIAAGLHNVAEAIQLNSVPWEMVFPGQRSPLWRLENKVRGGGGGISGHLAQRHNWKAVRELVAQGAVPVIAPSIMEYYEMRYVTETLGAQACSFGAIHMATKGKPWTVFTNPCKPTAYVRRYRAAQAQKTFV